jgi:hypothetical protein
VIDEGEPQRQPAARIQPQVAAISIEVNGRNFGSPCLSITTSMSPIHQTLPRGSHIAHSGAIVCIGADGRRDR